MMLTLLLSLSGGFTPLMLASFAGSGLDHCTSDESSGSGDAEEDSSVAIITDLINQGAAINAQTDRTGKSCS